MQKSPADDEDEEDIWKKVVAISRSKTDQDEIINPEQVEDGITILAEEGTDLTQQDYSKSTCEINNTDHDKKSRWSRGGLRLKIAKLGIIPSRDEMSEDSSSDGYETAEDSFLSEDDFMIPKLNIFDEDEFLDAIPQEIILRRINSHRRSRSYQLGEQLSFRWTTGAGPRIGCVRDYPSRLQFRALEQVNLSPRRTTSSGVPKVFGPSSLHRQTTSDRSSPLGADHTSSAETISSESARDATELMPSSSEGRSQLDEKPETSLATVAETTGERSPLSAELGGEDSSPAPAEATSASD
ncbi:hypothetical protein Dimus_001832 [Dionaea muscipula]